MKYLKYLKYSILIALGFSSNSKATVLTTDGLSMGLTSVSFVNTVDPTPTGSNFGYGAFALGENNEAIAGGAAIGYGNHTANYTLTVGEENQALGSAESFALGSYNILGSQAYWVFIGGDNNNTGYNTSSVVYGSSNVMGCQTGSAIFGIANTMPSLITKSGHANIILGENNSISNISSSDPSDIQGSVLIGVGNESHASMAYALGIGNIGQERTVTLGTFAATASDASLIVGNGTSYSSRSNVFLAMKDGSVVIPSGNLILNGESALTSTSAQSVISSHLTSNNYLKRSYGSGSVLSGGGLLSIGDNTSATAGNAIAVGYGTSASASDAIAMGTGSWSNGAQSVSIGTQSNAYGINSVVLGSYAYAYLDEAVAIGFGSTAVGVGSVAIAGGTANGDNSFASNYSLSNGFLSIAMGAGNATEYSSVAIGGFNEGEGIGNLATASFSAAIGGNYNQANGENSYAMGYLAIASSSYSNAFGFLVKTKAAYETVMGSKNLSSGSFLTPQDGTVWRENEALFELGNGNPSGTTVSNAITTFKNGQTVLTNKAWKQDANVTGTAENAQGEALVVEGHARMEGDVHMKGKVIIDTPQGDIAMGIYGN